MLMETTNARINDSLVTEFVLVSFTTEPHLQAFLFFAFLLSYILTLMGNLGLIILIFLNSCLHTPMYFFVGSLSFLDMWYSTVYTPRILADCMVKSKIISYAACATQFFFSVFLAQSECFLLAVMAYDRYVAICNPLLYSSIMTRSFCFQLVAASYATGFTNAIVHTSNTFHLHFCGDNIIDHYFCDALPLMKMACDDTHVYNLILAITLGCNMVAITALILGSYTAILAAILRIHSHSGWHKAFTTCSAHLISISLFYGSIFIMYLQPSSQHIPDWDKVGALFYTVVNPLVNPIIYSLRNKDVKKALKTVAGMIMRKREN
ncbi:olfactory receptor 9G4 [Alligator mississippiensis]|uniref:Olfactory receptor n=1 Tax=Alligator mississippiensis TaxID=8496 RepID=A0A151NXU3_ALLMI|nr:olfactory receptor 9G4 [Alligator mississippiensis]KYO41696.1 olfactory receptor 9G4-like [Alligator mississippiensis]